MALPFNTANVFVYSPNGKSQIRMGGGRERPVEAEATYICPWGSAISLWRELIGGMPTAAGSGFIVPAPAHAFPMSPNLYCYDAQIVPHEDVRKGDLSNETLGAWNRPTYALVNAKYKAPDYAVDQASANESNQIDPNNPIVGCRQRVQVSTAFLTFDGAQLKFTASNKVVESTDGIPANQVRFVLEYPRLRADPSLFLIPFKGKVNDATLWSLGPEQVLFDEFEVNRESGIDGTEVSATLTFTGSLDVTWNQRLNDEGEPENVVFVNSNPARKPFETAHLQDIF